MRRFSFCLGLLPYSPRAPPGTGIASETSDAGTPGVQRCGMRCDPRETAPGLSSGPPRTRSSLSAKAESPQRVRRCLQGMGALATARPPTQRDCMLTREESVDEFLKSGLWHIAEDREQTRRAVREFLLELPEDHFCRLRRGIAGLVVLAPSVFLGWTLLALEDFPPATPEYKQHFQTLHFDSRIEQYPYDQARAMMFEA